MLVKSISAGFKDLDVKSGIVTGYFANFGSIDSDGDRIVKGAFAKTIKENGPQGTQLIKHLLDHNKNIAVGKLQELKEDEVGLYYESTGDYFASEMGIAASTEVLERTDIVYTSNIMAVLGLRALYFALAAMVHRFHYLKYALAAVLVFIGSKIFISDFLMGGEKFPPVLSLAVTFGLILGGIAWSLWKTRGEETTQTH
jgi:hypothetical protein